MNFIENREDMIQLMIQMVEQLKSWKGKWISIRCQLSNRESFDRHGVSYTNFSMQLEDAMVRLSGARLMLLGQEGALFEASSGDFKDIQIKENQLYILEKIGLSSLKDNDVLRKIWIELKD